MKYLLLMTVLYACQPAAVQIKNIDLKKWQDDKNGCSSYRQTKIKDLELSKNVLLRLSEIEISKILGKPDETELIEKSQKIFTYYLEPNKHCSLLLADSIVKTIKVRFNAMGYCSNLILNNTKVKG